MPYATTWQWRIPPDDAPNRPMSNLLTVPALLPKGRHHYFSESSVTGNPANAFTDPVPAQRGALIRTDRGVQRLLNDELARGLGAPKEWKIEETTASAEDLWRSASLFHFEHLSASFVSIEGHQLDGVMMMPVWLVASY